MKMVNFNALILSARAPVQTLTDYESPLFQYLVSQTQIILFSPTISFHEFLFLLLYNSIAKYYEFKFFKRIEVPYQLYL